MKPIRVAVIGAGHLGRIHARLVRSLPGVELVAVVDPIISQREAVASECGTRPFASHEQLYGQIDAAIVATPTKHHYAVATDLLSNYIHLLIEKPITLTAADADELVAAAENAKRVLQVGHVERFNPAFLAARSYIEQPRLIQAVRAGAYSFRSTDVSVVLDLMIHDIDLALSLVDAEVQSVTAIGGKVIGPNEDWAQARLRFGNGTVATFFASRVHHTAERTFQATGRHGAAWIDFNAKTARVLEPSHEVHAGRIDPTAMNAAQRLQLKTRLTTELLPIRDLPVVENNAILEELREFVSAIRYRTSVTASGEVGRNAVAIAEAILAQIALTSQPSREADHALQLEIESISLSLEQPVSQPWIRKAA